VKFILNFEILNILVRIVLKWAPLSGQVIINFLMPKKNRKRTSSIPFSAPEAPPKKARKAVSKQQ
jgi:hypothetical protein